MSTIHVHNVAEGVLWLHPPDGGEVYIVRAGDGWVMVDSGLVRHRSLLLATMLENGLAPERFRLAIASHFHCDHTGDLGWWRQKYGIPVVAHHQAIEPMGRPDPVVTGSEIPFSDWQEPFTPCVIDHPVTGGETFCIADREFHIEAAPGHTVSGIHVQCGDWVFVGDNLFSSGGIGWMDIHWGSNPETYLDSIESLRQHCGKLIFAGHGAPYILRESILDQAIATVCFYIPPEHGLGMPRPSGKGAVINGAGKTLTKNKGGCCPPESTTSRSQV